MSTLEEFENAPFGATATQEGTRARAFRLNREFGETWIVAEMDGTFDVLEPEELVDGGFTLDTLPSRPTTVRGALVLAWRLAHPIPEGVTELPEGTRYLYRGVTDALIEGKATVVFTLRKKDIHYYRTLDPLPEPEPDWLDAPAVLATCGCRGIELWQPHNAKEGIWVSRGGENALWTTLRDVTPLYPREDQS